jgi:hypothetical protein
VLAVTAAAVEHAAWHDATRANVESATQWIRNGTTAIDSFDAFEQGTSKGFNAFRRAQRLMEEAARARALAFGPDK